MDTERTRMEARVENVTRDGERGRQVVDRVEREVFDSWNIEETCNEDGTE